MSDYDKHTDMIVTSMKVITGEKHRLTGFTSEDLFSGLSYVLKEVFDLSEEEIVKLFSVDFLKTYDLFRYYALIEVPEIYSKAKMQYILHMLCPSIVSFDPADAIWGRYLLNLRNGEKSFYDEFHDVQLTLYCIRKLLFTVFSFDTIDDLFDMSYQYKDEMEETLVLFGFFDFYELTAYCLPDLIFYTFSKEEKKKYFNAWYHARSRYPGGEEIMALITALNPEKFNEYMFR